MNKIDIAEVNVPIKVITYPKKRSREMEEVKLNVRIPSEYSYEIVVFSLSKLLNESNYEEGKDTDGNSQSNFDEVFDKHKHAYKLEKFIKMQRFKLEPNEQILDMKRVNLMCEEPTTAEYVAVSTSIMNATSGENDYYTARILVFDILHELER